MDRRRFVTGSAAAGLALRYAPGALAQKSGAAALAQTTGVGAQAQTAGAAAHRLPSTDSHYRRVRDYVEETPIAEYRWASPAAVERFRDMKFGVRVHWGIYSIEGLPNESWPFLKKSFPERAAYNEKYKTWDPKGFDATEWTGLFADAGARMFSFTAKHHEGFSMYDTAARVRSRVDWTAAGGPKIVPCDLKYSIMETPFRRDVTAELCDAAHKRNLAIDLYFSHPDWYDADFRPYAMHPLQTAVSIKDPEIQQRMQRGEIYTVAPDPTPPETARMIARHRAQLRELLTKYGRIDMMCLDQWFGPEVWPELRKTLLEMRSLQPDVMLRARGIGNYGDYYTPEGFVPGSKENTEMPWFVIYPLGRSFSYERDATKYKGEQWVVQRLVDTVAKGGNFMAGVGPDGDGRYHPEAARQLRATGDWLRVNGEGIYATRPRPGELWRSGDNIRYTATKDGRTAYAFTTVWPGRSLVLPNIRPVAGTQVRMLGYAKPLQWTWDSATGTTVQVPQDLQDESHRPCAHAWGFQMRVV